MKDDSIIDLIDHPCTYDFYNSGFHYSEKAEQRLGVTSGDQYRKVQ